MLIDKKGLRELWARYQKAIKGGELGAVKALHYWAYSKWGCRRDTFDAWIRKIKEGRYNLRRVGGLYSRTKRRKVWIYEDELERLKEQQVSRKL
jgi:hypothetical protein